MKIQHSTLNTQHSTLFSKAYFGKKVLVTGHTGFKGSWLIYWLSKMGANVCGYALKPPTTPNHFDLLKLNVRSEIADIRNKQNLIRVFADFKPEIVFHLAAQPLVRDSYQIPVETFETNVVGTINLFEACRNTNSVKAIVNVTSDKCYENKESNRGYKENDPMGGHDPYSASKGCAELVTSSYRNSFFNNNDHGKKHHTLLASCRAGNVIGGGDWARDRLVPDIVKATSKNKVVKIRNPEATRPWQHVLEPLSGYLLLGQKLLEGKKDFADAWNFGPSGQEIIKVKDLLAGIEKHWPKIKYQYDIDKNALHEANLLKLDCSKAHRKLKWFEVWKHKITIERTINWYYQYYKEDQLSTEDDLDLYITDAKTKKMPWTI